MAVAAIAAAEAAAAAVAAAVAVATAAAAAAATTTAGGRLASNCYRLSRLSRSHVLDKTCCCPREPFCPAEQQTKLRKQNIPRPGKKEDALLTMKKQRLHLL